MSAAPATESGEPPAGADQVQGPKVFAGNLSYQTTDEGLKAFFAPVASDITSASVILRGNRSAGYGFVGFTSEAAAVKAVELLNKTELDGRTVIIELAKPAEEKERRPRKPKSARSNRRGSKAPPGEVTEAEAEAEGTAAETKAEDAAADASGDASRPKKKKRTPKKPRAKAGEGEGDAAAAEGADATAADASGEASADAERKGRPRKPRVPRQPRRPQGEDPVGEPSKNMLFVANLGFNVDDAQLEALFKDANITVHSARVVRRRFGTPRKSKGYGFVDVGGEAEQQKAVEALDGKEIDGRAIAVKIAVNSQMAENAEEAPATIIDTPAAA